MNKYEYKFYQLSDKNIDVKKVEKEFNKFGENGWELTNTNNDKLLVFIFKREITGNKSNKLELLNDQFSDEITFDKLKD